MQESDHCLNCNERIIRLPGTNGVWMHQRDDGETYRGCRFMAEPKPRKCD